MTRIHQYYHYIFILLVIALFADTPNSTDKKSPWIIKNTETSFLQDIESRGGIVASVHPQKGTIVYLSANLALDLTEAGYSLEKEFAIKKVVTDSLQNNSIIGQSYHSYEAVLTILDSLHSAYPDISRLETIGYTQQNREIKAICLSQNINEEEIEPELKFIGNMHGNEVITQEVMLCAIDSLLSAYGVDGRITQLLDQAEIWFVPNLNFDGTAVNSRFNANGEDLNRNFPDREFDTVSDPAGREPETRAVINWSEQHNFVLSANFHAGAQLVNYPWDKNLTGQSGYAATPDDSLFIRLSLSYARHNQKISDNPIYENGITNGVLWYEIDGSMQDWNYHFLSGLEVTVELSDTLRPAAGKIKNIWRENSQSLFSYIEQAHTGLRGIVTDSLDDSPVSAMIEVLGIDKPVYTDPDLGDFYRLLGAGIYSIQISADGYHSKIISGIEVDSTSYVNLDVKLHREIFYSLRGEVVDSVSGLPIDQCRLQFYQNGILEDSVFSAPDGSFVSELAEGSYRISIEKDGYFELVDNLNLNESLMVRYALIPVLPTVIKGTLTAEDGGNIDGAVITCQNRSDVAGSDQSFFIDSLSADQINVFAYKYGYKTAYIDTGIVNGDTLNLQLVLSPGFNEFYSDFENASSEFRLAGDWQIGIATSGPGFAWSGYGVAGTNLKDDYSTGPTLSTLTTPFLFIQGLNKPVAEFHHWYSIEENYDGGNIKISLDEGKTWQIVNPSPDYPLFSIPDDFENPLAQQPAFSGKQEYWDQVTIDLDAYKNFTALLLRFEFGSDQQKVAPGWYFDQFKIFDANATDLSDFERQPDNYDMSLQVYPNPANPQTTIEIGGVEREHGIGLTIYSITGRQVLKKKIDNISSEILFWKWDGKNSFGHPVSSGLYLIRVKNGKRLKTSKILLIQ